MKSSHRQLDSRSVLHYKEIQLKLEELEKKYDKQFNDIYEAIGYLIQKDQEETKFKERKLIGYK